MPKARSDDLRSATEEALRVLEGLGARLHNVRLRPLRDYYAVWTVIEAPETFAIQRRALIERPQPNPNRFVPFTLTGRPAAVTCTGFGKAGLPLGMHLIGRPFDDANVLGIAHAYEQATGWSQRRAIISPQLKPAPIAHHAPAIPVSTMDPRIVDLCAQAAASAGLHLPDRPFALLCSKAPSLLEMTDRVRGSHNRNDPANVFTLPRAV